MKWKKTTRGENETDIAQNLFIVCALINILYNIICSQEVGSEIALQPPVPPPLDVFSRHSHLNDPNENIICMS